MKEADRKEEVQEILAKHQPRMDAVISDFAAFAKSQREQVASIKSDSLREAARKFLKAP